MSKKIHKYLYRQGFAIALVTSINFRLESFAEMTVGAHANGASLVK
jgi:hypothetical protein